MRFHGNQLSWAIKYYFISLCFKYHSPGFICFSTMLAPIISSLDEIYCTYHEPFSCAIINKSMNDELCWLIASEGRVPHREFIFVRQNIVHRWI